MKRIKEKEGRSGGEDVARWTCYESKYKKWAEYNTNESCCPNPSILPLPFCILEYFYGCKKDCNQPFFVLIHLFIFSLNKAILLFI